MKKKLYVAAFILALAALGLTACERDDPVTEDTSSQNVSTKAPESTAEDIDDALPTVLFKDNSLEVTRLGARISYTLGGKTSVLSLPDDAQSDIKLLTLSGEYYLAAMNTDSECALIRLDGKDESLEYFSASFETDTLSFYELGDLTLIARNGSIEALQPHKFTVISLENGFAILRSGQNSAAYPTITLCDPDSLEPNKFQEHDSGCMVFDSYVVSDGILFLLCGDTAAEYSGKASSILKHEIIYSDEAYILLLENGTSELRLFDGSMKLIFDYGYIDGTLKPTFERTDNGAVITVELPYPNSEPYLLYYPNKAGDILDTLAEGEGFSIYLTTDGVKFRGKGRNYFLDTDITATSKPIVFSKQDELDSDIVSTFLVWVEEGELLKLDVTYGRASLCQAVPYSSPVIERHGDKILVNDGYVNGFLIDESGNILLSSSFGEISAVGSYYKIIPPSGGVYSANYYRSDLTPLTDTPLITPKELPDGSIIGILDNHFEMFDADGSKTAESLEYEAALTIVYSDEVSEYGPMLLAVEGGRLKLIDQNENTLADFGNYDSELAFHYMLSGYIDKPELYGSDTELPTAYYFVFEDPNDVDNELNSHTVEYWYSPTTRESGIYEGGYSSFAYAKPILYLYPESTTELTVSFEHPERLTTVYPEYNNGWSVTADPNGTLSIDGRSYYALYWEEDSSYIPSFTDGFIVEDNYAEFLEEKLFEIGLTEREANEFIIYWFPILEKNERSLVYFELTEEREAQNKLNLSPAPDSLLRLAIHIKKYDGDAKPIPQTFDRFERIGFTAVEWGGRVYDR